MDPRYPVGRTRLETVGVILCAVIMALSSTEVVQSSVAVLWDSFSKGAPPPVRPPPLPRLGLPPAVCKVPLTCHRLDCVCKRVVVV